MGFSRSSNCHLPAACILKAERSADVAVVLRIVTTVGTKFAVRSGGQDPNPGFGSIDGSGILIDLARLNSTSISRDKKSVEVGPGARWGQVYKYLDPYGLSAVGARSPVPAVGGFLTGGGKLSWPPTIIEAMSVEERRGNSLLILF